MPWWGWMLIVIAILVVILVVLYIVGNRLQKKQSAQKEAMLQAAQPVTMLVIDKKMLPMKDANLPKQVESTPKRYQKAKLPIVKAKIGPQIINLICDDGIFDVMPVRGEVKAMVSGIYITSVKNVRGKKAPEPAKKSFSQKLRAKQKKYEQTYEQETASMKLSKEEKAARKAKAKEEKERAKKIQ